MATPCADPTCDRTGMRTRDGKRFCMYHPTATPPAMHLASGKLRDDKNQTPLVRSAPARTPAYRTSGRGAPSLRRVWRRGTQLIVDSSTTGPMPSASTPVTPEPSPASEELDGMDVLRAALATPPPVPIGGGTRCLLEKGEAHRDPQVRQAAKQVRRSIDILLAALQHADQPARKARLRVERQEASS